MAAGIVHLKAYKSFFDGNHYHGEVNAYRRPPESCGTTIVACQFDGGVLVGADTRTTMGSYVHNRHADKITEVTKHIYCLRSGGAAATQAIAELVRMELAYYEVEHGVKAPVHVAASAFRNLVYKYRDDLTAGIIVAGWDEQKGGQVYQITLGGMIEKLPVAATGSGSTYLVGYMDHRWRTDMKQDEAEKFLATGVKLAISRDGSSGGSIRLGIITKDGIQRKCIPGDEVEDYKG